MVGISGAFKDGIDYVLLVTLGAKYSEKENPTLFISFMGTTMDFALYREL